MYYIFRIRKIDICKLGPITKGSISIPDNYSNMKGFQSEVLGIYGPNGSGKSTVLDALDILSDLFSIYDFDFDNIDYESLIQDGSKSAKLSFSFDIFYSDIPEKSEIPKKVGSLTYSCKIKKSDGSKYLYRVVQESLKVEMLPDDSIVLYVGERTPQRDISNIALAIASKIDSDSYLYLYELLIDSKKESDEKGASIFACLCKRICSKYCIEHKEDNISDAYPQLIEYLAKIDNTKCGILTIIYNFVLYVLNSVYITKYDILDLRNGDVIEYYLSENIKDHNGNNVPGGFKVNIADSNRMKAGELLLDAVNQNRVGLQGLFGKDVVESMQNDYSNSDLSRHNNVVFSKYEPTSLDVVYSVFEQHVSVVSKLLKSIFPDINLVLEKNEEVYLYVEYADGTRITLNKESYGFKKIYMLIGKLWRLYHVPGCLLVIDEFDEGLFEFTFGELLASIREKAIGQLIFSAHNLRALENLEKSSIVFSTSDSNNRFVTLKNVKPSNNLRDVYIRRMYLSEGNQNLYSGSSISAMAFALERLGDESDEGK